MLFVPLPHSVEVPDVETIGATVKLSSRTTLRTMPNGAVVARHARPPSRASGDTLHPVLSRITCVHTLGPPGTSCDIAAHRWFERAGTSGSVLLYPTLEEAADGVDGSPRSALVACAAYTELHTLIYSRLDRLTMETPW
jgi:hypothetical protein